ncbi:sortase domain-bontaining protein [Streptomyces sp. NPDC059918]|uniref:sortase domain-containing protein n=1 Tax=unclassified Streptomyces TaxID=2593676 RepID=UPI003668B20F
MGHLPAGNGSVGGAPAGAGGSSDAGTVPAGQGFAVLHIPSLGMESPIAQGVSKTKVLDQGMVGHYDGTGGPASAMPGDKEGNFALAAHRNSHGEPFRRINRLHAGDQVVMSPLPGSAPTPTPTGPAPGGAGADGRGRTRGIPYSRPDRRARMPAPGATWQRGNYGGGAASPCHTKGESLMATLSP